MGGCISQRVLMLEHYQLAGRHFTARGGAVMLEHRCQRFEQQVEIVVRKAGPLGKFGRDEAMSDIEPVGHDVLAAHGAVVGAVA
ncbi:hypothetical protein D3C87_1849190 [compost metagenome]